MLARVLSRDRLIVATALALMTALAWGYVLWLAADARVDADVGGGMAGMSGMGASSGMSATGGMRMIPAGIGWMVPDRVPWSAGELVVVFVMWAVMMIGMMTPGAAPMILLYARIARQAAAQRTPFAPVGWFEAGYLSVWTAFALLATAAQWALERAELLDVTMRLAARELDAAMLIVAGLYQWTALKAVCLRDCQNPLAFIQRQGGFRGTPGGAWRLGILHGLYCLGCCWPLMLLLFVGGVMNVLWIAGISVLVLIEKVTPLGRYVSRGAGVGFVAAGIWLLLAR